MREIDIRQVRSLLNLPKDENIFLGISDVKIAPGLFVGNNKTDDGTLLSAPGQIEAFAEMFGVRGTMVKTQRSLP